ncbi:MAG: hypothetical protein Q4G09_08435, partial [Clostridia bacterium]|nr:hypothetical protein [Clostridia bacterium]
NEKLKKEIEELKNIIKNKEKLEDMNDKERNIKLPIGWYWNHYEDGSGCLKSPTGKNYFYYDWTTYEYKIHDEDQYSFFGNIDDFGNKITFEDFKQYAEKYANKNLVNLPENKLETDLENEESEDEL